MSTDEALLTLLGSGRLGVLATIRRDGRPQLSTVGYGYDPEGRTIRVSVTDDRAKTANMRRDARVAFHVSRADGWAYVVADGAAELSPVATEPDDAVVDELVALYRVLAGEHPDWDEFRAAMVSEGRLVLRIRVDRVYGMAG